MRVYIVEDSQRVRRIIEERLASISGIVLIGYSEGAPHAIEQIAALSPDIVVLDLQLNPGCGLDVLRHFRFANYHHIALVLSNHIDNLVRDQCRDYGASGCYDKSFEFDEFVCAIEELSRLVCK
jgi:DNA-binding NarL/FixJ family response regulator